MLTGSAQQTLDTLKQILSDLEFVAGKGVQTSLLSKIKNTMSDRHIVEKKFNHLLEEYRLEILPDVIDAWDDLSEEEKQQIASLNNFFCGMHLLVGMADTAARVLLQWEKVHIEGTAAHPGDIIVQKSESGTVRLVRTASKALSKHGSEQSGVYQPFTAYLSSHGVTRNPLASFRGNRFNILFYDAGALFTIAPLVEKFFMEVWQTPNQLLRAVLADIQVPQFRSGCKALGLINKMITGPLWRVLESHEISILEMNDRFLHLKSCLDKWSLDAMPLLCGEAVVYPDFPPSHDTIFDLLVSPSEYDTIAQEIVQMIFSAFSSLLSRMVEDHLPGGIYDNPSARLVSETKSVPKTNTVSERDFAKLDRLLREKPNATTLSIEGMILFSNNKTARWLNSKSEEERQQLMQKARTLAPEFRKQYKLRKLNLLQERARILQAKKMELERMREKRLKEKEELTQSILLYGLWQSTQDIEKGLSLLKTKREKVKALKTQLDFRKKVLEQAHPDKSVFFITRHSRQLSITEISNNLGRLLSSSQTQSSPISPSVTLNCESLIGKEINHRWKSEGGVERWYRGTVLSLVPGTTDWFNVQYEGEDDVMSLNLLMDIENGDLDIVGSS